MDMALYDRILELGGRFITTRRLDGLAEWICDVPWFSMVDDAGAKKIIRHLEKAAKEKERLQRPKAKTQKEIEEEKREAMRARVAESARNHDPAKVQMFKDVRLETPQNGKHPDTP